MAAITVPATFQHSVARHSLHSAYISPPAPAPYEGIVDFTRPGSHTQFGPYSASSDIAFQHQSSLPHRPDGTEWKQPSFFSYRPNEVKHRKRTTRQQLKVLEETFRTTQKPDGNVRKALAAQLDMTPRNVQVWFQNRRAKDKTLAKRALKNAEETQGKDSPSTLEEPSVQTYESEQYAETYESPSEGQVNGAYPPSEQSHHIRYPGSVSTTHSGSTSPVDATFQQKFEVPTPVHISKDITTPSTYAVSSTSTSFTPLEADHASSQMFNASNAYAVEANPSSYQRNLFAPRASLPHIHATPYPQDIQHQRSNSSPAFLCNVDNSSNLSLTTYASINGVLYPQRFASNLSQQPTQAMYNPSFSRVPSGPLPSSDFTFGLSTLNNARSSGAEADRDSDAASFAAYQFGSVSGSNTPSSLGNLSQYGSVASLLDGDVASIAAQGFEDDSTTPFGWQNEQRRGSAPIVRPIPTSRLNRGFSPLSVGFSNCSPRAGATPSTEPETDGSDSAAYMTNRSEWMPPYAEESKPKIQQVMPSDVKTIGAYQHDTYGFVEQDTSNLVDGAFQSTYMPMIETPSYGHQMTLANQISGLNTSFGADNQIPMDRFRPVMAAGYPFA